MSPNGKLDPEIIGIAVGISVISCLEAKIHALEVKMQPSWIFSTFGFVAQYTHKSQWNARPQKRRFRCWNLGYSLCVALSGSEDTRI